MRNFKTSNKIESQLNNWQHESDAFFFLSTWLDTWVFLFHKNTFLKNSANQIRRPRWSCWTSVHFSNHSLRRRRLTGIWMHILVYHWCFAAMNPGLGTLLICFVFWSFPNGNLFSKLEMIFFAARYRYIKKITFASMPSMPSVFGSGFTCAPNTWETETTPRELSAKSSPIDSLNLIVLCVQCHGTLCRWESSKEIAESRHLKQQNLLELTDKKLVAFWRENNLTNFFVALTSCSAILISHKINHQQATTQSKMQLGDNLGDPNLQENEENRPPDECDQSCVMFQRQ